VFLGVIFGGVGLEEFDEEFPEEAEE